MTETEPQYGDTLIQLTFYLLLDLNDEKGTTRFAKKTSKLLNSNEEVFSLWVFSTWSFQWLFSKLAQASRFFQHFTCPMQSYWPQFLSQFQSFLEVFKLISIWFSGKDSMIWHIILVLEEAIEKSTTNPYLKLLLVFLYGKIGKTKMINNLNIKVEDTLW